MMSTRDARPPRRRVDGVLLLDKPLGMSSNAALQRVKRLYAAERAGHTGTLDPLATGLLPICLGEATKFAQTLLGAGKSYIATIRFGTATTTGDAEGAIVEERPVALTEDVLRCTLQRFTGVIHQQPPRHAALKFEGRSYYEYARAGVEIPRAPREVTIESLVLRSLAPPLATIEVACGKGTYIRVLAEDLGRALDSCAHLAALRRTASGPFALSAAVTLDALEAMGGTERDARLLPVDAPLVALPRLTVERDVALSLSQGRTAPPIAADAGRYRCYERGGHFVGLVDVGAMGVHAARLVRSLSDPRE